MKFLKAKPVVLELVTGIVTDPHQHPKLECKLDFRYLPYLLKIQKTCHSSSVMVF